MARQRKLHYAWIVAGVTFLTLLVAAGLLVAAFWFGGIIAVLVTALAAGAVCGCLVAVRGEFFPPSESGAAETQGAEQ